MKTVNYRDFTESELKWIKSLQRVMDKAPNTLFLFVGGSYGDAWVMPMDNNNQRYMNDRGYVDGEAPRKDIPSPMAMDGGDW